MSDNTAATDSAFHTLDQIKAGGQRLVAVAMERLKDCEQAIVEGRFTDALDRVQELAARLSPLATAQAQIGTFGGSFLVRARDVECGMVLQHWGRVTGVRAENKEVPGGTTHTHVHLEFEGDTENVEVNGEAEVLAVIAQDES